MRRCLTGLLVLLALVALPSLTAAQDCRYHKVKFEFKTQTWIEPGYEGFDACIEVPKIVGTINGSYLECFNWSDWIPSPLLYGDAFWQIFAVKITSWIQTDKGDLELREWLWWDDDIPVEAGFAKIVGGSGDFEGAYGTLTYMTRSPADGEAGFMEGYVCTP